MCVCARVLGPASARGGFDRLEGGEGPGEGLTARAGKVEATATATARRGRSKATTARQGDGDGPVRRSGQAGDGGAPESTGTTRQGRRRRGTGRRQREVGDEKLKIFEVFLI